MTSGRAKPSEFRALKLKLFNNMNRLESDLFDIKITNIS